MIARLWRTGIDPVRGAEYDAFAATYSRPMFGALAGCLGAFFLGTGEVRSVLSLWADRASIVLREPQTVDLFEVTGGTVNALGLAAELSRAPHNAIDRT